jgi:hypothetical protein
MRANLGRGIFPALLVRCLKGAEGRCREAGVDAGFRPPVNGETMSRLVRFEFFLPGRIGKK